MPSEALVAGFSVTESAVKEVDTVEALDKLRSSDVVDWTEAREIVR
jgi:hypothetical protein